MSENSTHTDLLIQYMDGELSGEQLEILEKNLRDDAVLRDEYASLKMTREAMKSYGLKSKIQTIHTEMMGELKSNPAIPQEGVRKILPMAWG